MVWYAWGCIAKWACNRDELCYYFYAIGRSLSNCLIWRGNCVGGCNVCGRQ